MSQYLTTNHDTERINFYLNDTNAASSISMTENHTNLEQSESSKVMTTPSKIEMNTYVQLEMDNNNHACIPRVCRFCVARITLNNNDNSSVILGVKLDASKRSIRTVDIPLKNNSADLNLNYNIAYPHFLKKDTNFIYFYVQKRKKLKNRTILGKFNLNRSKSNKNCNLPKTKKASRLLHSQLSTWHQYSRSPSPTTCRFSISTPKFRPFSTTPTSRT